MTLDGSRCVLRDAHGEIQHGDRYDFALLSGVCDQTGSSIVDDENYVTFVGRLPVVSSSESHSGQRQLEGYVFVSSALAPDPEVWAVAMASIDWEVHGSEINFSGLLTATAPRERDRPRDSKLMLKVVQLPVVRSSNVLPEIQNRRHRALVPAISEWSP